MCLTGQKGQLDVAKECIKGSAEKSLNGYLGQTTKDQTCFAKEFGCTLQQQEIIKSSLSRKVT